jgi:LacI family transcriptional regulator, repressor for deo operon, udp, cdd, tsx, nupC, and nupG
MPTIHDVARLAGVGIGTVSRVLNRGKFVSPATRERVLEAIERLGYEPSPVARAFRRQRTQQLDVVVPHVAQPFVLDIFRGVEQTLADTDYTLRLHTVLNGDDRQRVFEACCRAGRADGLLLVWMPPTNALVERALRDQVPIVLLNSSYPDVCSVGVDHHAAAANAVTYCLGLGHRRIALIDRPPDPFGDAAAGVCQSGYREALSAAGLDPHSDYQHLAQLSPGGGSDGMEALLRLAQPPTAVLVGSDMQAIGALQMARRRDRSVPRDLSLVGYNDNQIAEFFQLTTVSVPLRDLGRQAAAHLLEAIAEPHAGGCTTLLPTHLTVRKTCGPPSTQE